MGCLVCSMVPRRCCLSRLRLRSLILRANTSVPWYKKYNWYSFALYRYKAALRPLGSQGLVKAEVYDGIWRVAATATIGRVKRQVRTEASRALELSFARARLAKRVHQHDLT